MKDLERAGILESTPLRSVTFRIAFLVTYLWSSGLIFKVAMPITNSGVLAVYGSDILALPVMLWIIWKLWVGRKVLPRALIIFAAVYLGFFAYCLAVFAYRFATGTVDMQSLVIPRATLVSSLILLVILLAAFSLRELMIAAYAFGSTLALVAAPMALYEIYLPFTIFENLAIRADLQLFLMPLLLVGVLKRGLFGFGPTVNWLFALNLASLIFCSIVSGARVNGILVPIVVLVASSAILLVSGQRKILRLGIAVALPIGLVALILVAVAPINERVQYGLERNIFYSEITDLVSPSNAPSPTVQPTKTIDSPPVTGLIEPDEPVKATDNDSLDDEAEQSAETSTSIRTEVWPKAWNDFAENVWFGTGLKQYEVTYVLDETYTSVIQPHNFILEYLMAYGIFGFLWWLALFFYWPVALAASAMRSGADILLIGALFALSIAFVFGASFFQPLMLYPNILLTVYFIVGLFSKLFNSRARPNG